jgi:uroporphyrinogen-III synthase
MNFAERIAAYEAATKSFEEQVAALDRLKLDVKHPEGWSPRQVIHHLADSEAQSYARLRRLVAEPAGSIIQGYDEGQFDSEALWQQVRSQVKPGFRVLIVRGDSAAGGDTVEGIGRDWFAQQITQAGGKCAFVVAYQRLAPVWSPQEKIRIKAAASDGSFWLLSSTEALGNLIASLPGHDWQHAKAVATHPRIAKAAQAAGFGTVLESRPLIQEVSASIESSL